MDGAQRVSGANSATRTCARCAGRLDTAGCARLSPAIPPPRAPYPLQFGTQKKSHQKETFPCQWASMDVHPQDLSASLPVISYRRHCRALMTLLAWVMLESCTLRFRRLLIYNVSESNAYVNSVSFKVEGREVGRALKFFHVPVHTRTSNGTRSKRFCLYSYIIFLLTPFTLLITMYSFIYFSTCSRYKGLVFWTHTPLSTFIYKNDKYITRYIV